MAKKIMFSDKFGLTKAVLEGRKTQTRRIVKHHVEMPIINSEYDLHKVATGDTEDLEMSCMFGNCAYGVGEEVAVAQKYSELEYGVDWVRLSINKEHAGWGNKMFVSAEEMPHRIKITDIRVERLQDISDEDCLKEGIGKRGDTPLKFFVYGEDDILFDTPQRAFATLIDKVSGKGTWDSNPYVFVYDFELIK